MTTTRDCRINTKIPPVGGGKIEDGVKFFPNSRQTLMYPVEPFSNCFFNKTVQ
jgi:hypothetical protein